MIYVVTQIGHMRDWEIVNIDGGFNNDNHTDLSGS